MVVKYGKYGKFLACPGYPDCKNVKSIVEKIDVPCPKCGGTVLVKKTKKKKSFYVCENNNDNAAVKCDYISWNKPKPGEKYSENGEQKEVKKTTTKRKTTTSSKKRTTKKK